MLHNEAYMANLRVVDPGALETIHSHGAVAPGRIREQDAVAKLTAKHDEVVVAQGMDRYQNWSAPLEVIEREIAVAGSLVAAPINVAFEVKQRKPLAELHELGILEVFAAMDERSSNFFFGDGIAVLVAQQCG